MEIINLDMTPSTVTPNAHAGQYDSARTVRFMLKNGGVPFTLAGTETITAEITRSDNTEVTVNVANTSSNYVDVVFDDTVCTVKGLYACELRLKDSDGFDIGSKNFALLVQRDPYDNKNVRIVTVGPADICTFETTLPEPYQSVLVNVVATGGNGTPNSPIPIVGYSSANITRCGVNLWDEEWEVGSINDSGANATDNAKIRSKNYIPIIPNTTYFIACPSSSKNGKAFFYDSNQTFISSVWFYGNAPTTPPSNARYMRFRMVDAYGNTYNHDISINYPSTDTQYHPYNGQTYTIAFGQTVYGGVLDVTRGKLHVTWGICDLTDYNYTYNSTHGAFYTYGLIGTIKAGTANILCSHYKTNIVGVNVMNNYEISTVNSFNTGNVIIKDSDYTDAATFKTALGTMGAKLAFELDTPFDIDLTPKGISAVVGTNNVFADCGQTTVKYLKVEA